MIASVLTPDALMAILWTVVSFVAGVAYAAYRAVGWVERMRAWARSVEIVQDPEGKTS